MQVEIWSDVVCPWCYLGKRRFEQALAAFAHRNEVEVVYRSFELDPTAPPGVTVSTVDMLADRYGLTVAQAEHTQRQMAERAAADGLDFELTGLRTGNTRDAHRLVHFAKQQGRQAELVERLHRAHFIEGRSIFDQGELAEIAAEGGLEADEAARVLAGTDYTDEVAEDELTARALGATGVPFFVVDRRYGVAGAEPTDVLLELLDRAWADAGAA